MENWSPAPPWAWRSTHPKAMLVWGAPHAGPWELMSPLAFGYAMVPCIPTAAKRADPKCSRLQKMNARSATKQDLLFYRKLYAKYAERTRIARQPPLLLLIVIKTCNTQGAAAIFLIQFTDKMGASVLLMVTEWGSSPALQLSPHLWLHLIQ